MVLKYWTSIPLVYSFEKTWNYEQPNILLVILHLNSLEKHHFWEGGRYIFLMMKTADASFKTVTEFQKMKADCTIVLKCMYVYGKEWDWHTPQPDSSRFFPPFPTVLSFFLKKVQLCAHSWVFLLLASRGQWGTAYEKSQVPTHTAQSPAGVAPLSP